ncbi:MAG: MBG domain-containing protein, partial [Verrucomicrobiota bacterium]
LRATDVAGNRAERAITVTVGDVDEVAPEIAGSATPSVRENITTVGTYTANEPVTWSISGGVDAARFVVTDGVLSFATPPDFEAPGDADGDNVYLVVLRATDVAGNSTDRAITVTVGDENEPLQTTGPLFTLTAVYRQEFQWALPSNAFTDPEPDQTIQWTLFGLPRGLSFDPQRRSIGGSPDQIGEYPLTLVARDSGNPPATNTARFHLQVLPAEAVLTLSRLEQLYDGQPKRIEVSTDPEGLEVEVTYSGSRTPPVMPGSYSVVVFARDPNVAGLGTGTLVIHRPAYALRLNPAASMVVNEDSGIADLVPSVQDLVEVRGPEGRPLGMEDLGALRMSLDLVFTSPPKDEQGRVRGHVERHEGGVWIRPPIPSEESPLVVPMSEWQSGLVVYVPNPQETGRHHARWPFYACLRDSSGVRLGIQHGGNIDLSVRNVPDAPEAVFQPLVTLRHGDAVILGLHDLFRDRDPGSSASLRFRLAPPDSDIEARISGSDLQIISMSKMAAMGHVGIVAMDPRGLEARLNLAVASLGDVPRTNRVPTLSMWSLSEDGGTPIRRVTSESGPLVWVQPENRIPVSKVEGLDPDGDRLEFGLIGPDARLFTIDGDGWLKVRRGLDFENPTDQERAGRYRLAVTVQDGRGGQRIQPVEIQVANVLEVPEPRAGQVPSWLMPRPSSNREYRISEAFVDPEGGSLGASIRNAGALVKLGIEASLDGDRLSLRRVGDGLFPGQAILRLALEARGGVREIEVPLLSDSDDDGIDDLTESLAGDLNQDGIPDRSQGTVMSFAARVSGEYDPSGVADPASFLCLIIDGNPWMSRLLHPRWEAVPARIIAEWRAALAPRGIRDLRPWGGFLGYTLESGPKVSDPAGRLRSASATQHRVRVLLPAGIRVNTCIKTNANGVPYEFLKAPLLDGSGHPRTDDAGGTLFTGAEFRPSAVAGIPDEVWIHLVDNERGDDDPTPGRILNPGVLAEVDRTARPATPRIDLHASPASASAMALEGSAEPGAMIRLWESGLLQAEVRADALGRWRWHPVSSPEAGLHRYAVSAREVSGEESSRSPETWVVVEAAPGNLSSDPRPAVAPSLSLDAGGLRMRLPGVPGKRFRVLAASSMVVPPVDWQELGRAQADPDGNLWWMDPKLLEPQRFYRIEPVESP